jgi:dTDP-glucose 4,6-dehydratase
MLCAVYASNDLQPTIARCFAFVGPYLPLNAHFAIGNFVRDALQRSPVRVLGDGTPWRSYLYGSDLAAWLWTILLRGTASRPYNVGSPTALKIADIARAVASEVEPPVPVTIAQNAVPDARTHRYVPDTMRAMDELNTQQTVPLNSAIQRTLAWHKRQNAQEPIG